MAELPAPILKRINILGQMEERLLRGQATQEQIAAEKHAMIKPAYINRGRPGKHQEVAGMRANNSTGATGVVRQGNRYRYFLTYHGIREWGSCKNFEEAVAARKELEKLRKKRK